MYSPLNSLAKTVIMTGEMAETPNPYPGRNSSHTLHFIGPQISCETRYLKQIVDAEKGTARLTGATYNYTTGDYTDRIRLWGIKQLWFGIDTPTMETNQEFSIEQKKVIGALGCKGPRSCPFLAIENTNSTCREQLVKFTATFFWVNGNRRVVVQKAKLEPQPLAIDDVYLWRNGTTSFVAKAGRYDLPQMHLSSQSWVPLIRSTIPYWNSYMILDTFVRVLYSTENLGCSVQTYPSMSTSSWEAPNGTVLDTTVMKCTEGVKIYNVTPGKDYYKLKRGYNLLSSLGG